MTNHNVEIHFLVCKKRGQGRSLKTKNFTSVPSLAVDLARLLSLLCMLLLIIAVRRSCMQEGSSMGGNLLFALEGLVVPVCWISF